MKQLLVSCLIVFCSCEGNGPVLKIVQGNAFGTTYSIQYYSDKEFDAEKGIDSVIYIINRSVSTYMPNSDISKINRGDTTIVTDQTFREVFLLSEEVYKKTGGYFDPTIGVLRNAYGFGDTKALKDIDRETIDSLMQYVGFHKVKLSEDGTVRKKHPHIYFDFNAVAKGYGIDRMARFFDAEGITDYLIEVGGEIVAKGTNKAKGQPWIVGVEAVTSEIEDRSFAVTLYLKDEAMASSGNYRKFRIDSLTGKKYVHTINPLTGSAMQSDLTSATVIAATCAEADAYATAFMALGLDSSKKVLDVAPGLEAYFTYSDSLGTEKVFMTQDFEKRIVN